MLFETATYSTLRGTAASAALFQFLFVCYLVAAAHAATHLAAAAATAAAAGTFNAVVMLARRTHTEPPAAVRHVSSWNFYREKSQRNVLHSFCVAQPVSSAALASSTIRKPLAEAGG